MKLRFSKGEGREGQLRSPVHCVWGFEEEEEGGASKGFSGVRKREEEKRSEKRTRQKWGNGGVRSCAVLQHQRRVGRSLIGSRIRQIDGEEENHSGGRRNGEGKKEKGAIGDRAKRKEEDRREGKTIFQIWMGGEGKHRAKPPPTPITDRIGLSVGSLTRNLPPTTIPQIPAENQLFHRTMIMHGASRNSDKNCHLAPLILLGIIPSGFGHFCPSLSAQ